METGNETHGTQAEIGVYITVLEASKKAGVGRQAIRQWIAKGLVRSMKLTKGLRYELLVHSGDLKRLIQK